MFELVTSFIAAHPTIAAVLGFVWEHGPKAHGWWLLAYPFITGAVRSINGDVEAKSQTTERNGSGSVKLNGNVFEWKFETKVETNVAAPFTKKNAKKRRRKLAASRRPRRKR